MDYTILSLKPGKTQSIDRRHPWIFSGALRGIPTGLNDGDKVMVSDPEGKIRATGHFGSASIAVRILSFNKLTIGANFYIQKLQEAFDWRLRAGLTKNSSTNAYRLVHGEGDQLPGLVIDIYHNVAVVQVHSAGMANDVPFIEEGLRALYGKKLTVVVKSADRNVELVKTESGGKTIEILENKVRFAVDVEQGQKTGFFLDQRENRLLLAKYASNKKVLNSFCYSGGFSMYALGADAAEVHSIDSSKSAMKLVDKNLELNGFDLGRHRSMTGDAMNYLLSKEAEEAGYDIIVLDPPAFAKHLSARHKAVQAYKRLNTRALSILKPNGILFTFSCSQVVDTPLFERTIASAAMDSNRNIRVLHHLHQPEDHPVSIFHPEGSYLKGMVLAVS